MKKKKQADLRLKITIDSSSAERTKIFGVRRILTYNSEVYKRRGELDESEQSHFNEGHDLAKRLFELDGVQAVIIDQYDVYVTIGRAYDWREDYLELEIHGTIRKYLETQVMMEDISNKSKK